MGRREQRAELRANWIVLEPRVPGTPFRRNDFEDAEERAREEARRASLELERPYVDADVRYVSSRRTYLPALSRAAHAADQERLKSTMPG